MNDEGGKGHVGGLKDSQPVLHLAHLMLCRADCTPRALVLRDGLAVFGRVLPQRARALADARLRRAHAAHEGQQLCGGVPPSRDHVAQVRGALADGHRRKSLRLAQIAAAHGAGQVALAQPTDDAAGVEGVRALEMVRVALLDGVKTDGARGHIGHRSVVGVVEF